MAMSMKHLLLLYYQTDTTFFYLIQEAQIWGHHSTLFYFIQKAHNNRENLGASFNLIFFINLQHKNLVLHNV